MYDRKKIRSAQNVMDVSFFIVSADDATELKWEFDEDLGRYFVSFPVDQ